MLNRWIPNHWLIDDVVELSRVRGFKSAIIVMCLLCMVLLGIAIALQQSQAEMARRGARARRRADAKQYFTNLKG